MAIHLMKLRLPRLAMADRAPRQQTRASTDSVVRFDPHQRVQHFLMMSSFIVLALTGLPQRFSGLDVSQWWVSTLGGLHTVRIIHRTAGVIMLSDCLYHIGYLSYRFGVQRRLELLRMVPNLKDLRDAFQMILYFLGLAPEKPKFDRFSYLEKFDYWAVFWGIAVIGGSGLILMFPLRAAGLLSGQAVAVALTIHGDEAVLAVGWILVMHMFNVHLAPWVFPFNPSIFTGKISGRRCAEEHPLEWARILASRPAPLLLPAQACAGASECASAGEGPAPAAVKPLVAVSKARPGAAGPPTRGRSSASNGAGRKRRAAS